MSTPTEKLKDLEKQASKTILFIEDDAASQMLVDRTLRYGGYNVLLAERGLQGIDIARSEDIDLVLTDISLPDVNGRELTTMLRADNRFSETPIVVLTPADHEDQRDLSMAAGLSGYLTRPLDVESLPGQLKFYMDGGRDEIEPARLDAAKAGYTKEVVAHLESRIRELEEKNKDLVALDQIKDSFIQITAHELRTPLTLVYGYSRLLQDSPQVRAALGEDQGDSLIKGLVEAVERMQTTVNEILTISRIMTNEIDLSFGPTNLLHLLDKLIKKYASVLDARKLTLTLERESFPNSIRADGDMIQLVLDNLLSNAIKYTPDGGAITIRAENDGTYITIDVIDTGIGIAEVDIDLIFERFHTANDPQLHSTSKTAFSGGGLGLGLAICKGIAEAHGGSITAESPYRDRENPPGSKFHLILPLVARGANMATRSLRPGTI